MTLFKINGQSFLVVSTLFSILEVFLSSIEDLLLLIVSESGIGRRYSTEGTISFQEGNKVARTIYMVNCYMSESGKGRQNIFH